MDAATDHPLPETLLSLVERLWRKARNTPFPAEAEAFEAKALRLMARHQITMAMLDVEGDDPLVDLQVGERVRGRYVAPLEGLFNVVCRAYDCRAWFRVYGDGRTFFATGFRTDAQRVQFLYPFLATDALGQAAALRSAGSSAATMARRRNFLFGYAEAVRERFADARQAAIAEHDQHHGGTSGAELVLVHRAERVDERIRAMRLSPSRAYRPPSSDGFGAGQRAGRAADLSGGRHRIGRDRALGAAG
jgi:hypothetical protein